MDESLGSFPNYELPLHEHMERKKECLVWNQRYFQIYQYKRGETGVLEVTTSVMNVFIDHFPVMDEIGTESAPDSYSLSLIEDVSDNSW